MTHASTAVGETYPEEHALDLIIRLNEAKGTAARWELLGPLLQALSDQLDGAKTARNDLKAAVDDILKYRKWPRDWPEPDLSKATNRRDFVAAIHDIAHYVESKKLGNWVLIESERLGNQQSNDEEFKAAVVKWLNEQIKSPEKTFIQLLDHTLPIELEGNSKLVREVLDELKYRPEICC